MVDAKLRTVLRAVHLPPIGQDDPGGREHHRHPPRRQGGASGDQVPDRFLQLDGAEGHDLSPAGGDLRHLSVSAHAALQFHLDLLCSLGCCSRQAEP
jgi:hypothetical protein